MVVTLIRTIPVSAVSNGRSASLIPEITVNALDLSARNTELEIASTGTFIGINDSTQNPSYSANIQSVIWRDLFLYISTEVNQHDKLDASFLQINIHDHIAPCCKYQQQPILNILVPCDKQKYHICLLEAIKWFWDAYSYILFICLTVWLFNSCCDINMYYKLGSTLICVKQKMLGKTCIYMGFTKIADRCQGFVSDLCNVQFVL